jgi:hypothetical protein
MRDRVRVNKEGVGIDIRASGRVLKREWVRINKEGMGIDIRAWGRILF